MTELVRVAVLTGYCEVMRGLGVDPLPLLREVGLSEKLLANPEQTVSRRSAVQLLDRGVEVTGSRTIGLRMAECRGLANLGVTGLLIALAPNLADALATLGRYRIRINSRMRIQTVNIGDGILIRQDFAVGRSEISQQFQDLGLGVLARICVEVLGENWRPNLVCVAHEPPSPGELHVYRQMFRCPIDFNSEFNGLVVGPDDFERPNRRADSALADHARNLIDAANSPDQQSLTQNVEQSMLLLMPSGRATIQTCSLLLGMSVRTLQRALDAEGTSFSELINGLRIQLSGQYLANPHYRISDVADLLGYGSISAFGRWHAQTFGMQPKERRKTVLAGRPRSQGNA